MGKMQGSSSCLFASAGSGLRLPPGGASLDLTTVEMEKGIKRKRDQTPSPLLRPAQPTLETAEQGKSPYAGKVPENLVVGHVDCQGYYDQEVERLQAETMYRDKGEGRRKPVEGKGKPGAMQVEDTNAKLAFLLDYGLPDEEQHGPRKKARFEQSQEAITLNTDTRCALATSQVEASANSTNTCSSSDETTHSVRNSALNSNQAHTDCDVVWKRIKSKYTPSQLASLEPTSAIESHSRWQLVHKAHALLVRSIAIHPLTKSPEIMNSVSVVTQAEFGTTHATLQTLGPLLQRTQWEEYQLQSEQWQPNEQRLFWPLHL